MKSLIKSKILKFVNGINYLVIYLLYDLIITVCYSNRVPYYHFILIFLSIKFEVFQWYIMLYAIVFTLLHFSIKYEKLGNYTVKPFKRYLTSEDFLKIGNPWSVLGSKAAPVLAKAAPVLISATGGVLVTDHILVKTGVYTLVQAQTLSACGVDQKVIADYSVDHMKGSQSIIEKFSESSSNSSK